MPKKMNGKLLKNRKAYLVPAVLWFGPTKFPSSKKSDLIKQILSRFICVPSKYRAIKITNFKNTPNFYYHKYLWKRCHFFSIN